MRMYGLVMLLAVITFDRPIEDSFQALLEVEVVTEVVESRVIGKLHDNIDIAGSGSNVSPVAEPNRSRDA